VHKLGDAWKNVGRKKYEDRRNEEEEEKEKREGEEMYAIPYQK
jgi:hypothetical protein